MRQTRYMTKFGRDKTAVTAIDETLAKTTETDETDAQIITY